MVSTELGRRVMCICIGFSVAFLVGRPLPAVAGELLVEFEEAPGELHQNLRGAEIRVFDDGLVELTRPPYMKAAGSYTTRLSAAELDGLVSGLLDAGVAEFDPAAVRAARQASLARRERGSREQPLQFLSDPEIVRIRFHLPADASARRGYASEVDASVRWVGLSEDRRQFPDVDALQKLGRAADRLRGLMQRPDLGGANR